MWLSNSLVSVNFRLKSSPVEYLGDRPPLSRHLTKKSCEMLVVVAGGCLFFGGQENRRTLAKEAAEAYRIKVFRRYPVWRWDCMQAFHAIGAQNQQSKQTFQYDTVNGRNPAPPQVLKTCKCLEKECLSFGAGFFPSTVKQASIRLNSISEYWHRLSQITDWKSLYLGAWGVGKFVHNLYL